MRYKVKVSTSKAMAYEPNDTVNSTGRAKNTQAHTHTFCSKVTKKKEEKKNRNKYKEDTRVEHVPVLV